MALPENNETVSTAEFTIEQLYQQQIHAMPPCERVARSAAMFQWTREQIARQIVAEQGPVDAEKLRWLTALRLYGNEPAVRELIERRLAQYVSG